MASRLGKALREAARNRDSRELVQPHLHKAAVSARQLRQHLVETVRVLTESTGVARDLEQDLSIIEVNNLEEQELSVELWDDVAQLATLAERMDDVFFAYDPRLWGHLLRTVEIDVYEEALETQELERLLLLLAPLQRVIDRVRQKDKE